MNKKDFRAPFYEPSTMKLTYSLWLIAYLNPIISAYFARDSFVSQINLKIKFPGNHQMRNTSEMLCFGRWSRIHIAPCFNWLLWLFSWEFILPDIFPDFRILIIIKFIIKKEHKIEYTPWQFATGYPSETDLVIGALPKMHIRWFTTSVIEMGNAA